MHKQLWPQNLKGRNSFEVRLLEEVGGGIILKLILEKQSVEM
jgi:hypothetical protein